MAEIFNYKSSNYSFRFQSTVNTFTSNTYTGLKSCRHTGGKLLSTAHKGRPILVRKIHSKSHNGLDGLNPIMALLLNRGVKVKAQEPI